MPPAKVNNRLIANRLVPKPTFHNKLEKHSYVDVIVVGAGSFADAANLDLDNLGPGQKKHDRNVTMPFSMPC